MLLQIKSRLTNSLLSFFCLQCTCYASNQALIDEPCPLVLYASTIDLNLYKLPLDPSSASIIIVQDHDLGLEQYKNCDFLTFHAVLVVIVHINITLPSTYESQASSESQV